MTKSSNEYKYNTKSIRQWVSLCTVTEVPIFMDKSFRIFD